MVYVHGGGAQEGIGQVDGLHSNAALAAYSSELSLQTVTVNIGYRLNWLGSLVCQDVLDEYNADPSVSPHGPFNLTIQDQRAAFAWIHKYISGFGGDSNNITAYGESAGSIFLVYHMCGSPERLFNRVILQSGVIFGHGTFEQKNAEYQGLLKHFGIEDTSASKRLEKLRQVPAALLAKYPGQHTLPFVGDVPGVSIKKPLFPRGSPTFSEQTSLISSCPWLEDIIIGDNFWEGYLFRDFIRGASPKRLLDTVRSIFPEQQAARLLEAYNLPATLELAARVDGNLFWGNLMYFVGDMLFSQPIHNMATELALKSATSSGSARKRKIYRYSFGLTNPFPGSEHSFVTGHHFVEVLFLFLTLLDRYPQHRDRWLENQAKETAKRWIMFANGKGPWDEYVVHQSSGTGDARIAVCDDIRGWHVKTVSQDEEESKSDPWGRRRYDGWAAIEGALQSLKAPEMDQKTFGQTVQMARLQVLGSVVGLPSN
jgi:carboxylesterase type B